MPHYQCSGWAKGQYYVENQTFMVLSQKYSEEWNPECEKILDQFYFSYNFLLSMFKNDI